MRRVILLRSPCRQRAEGEHQRNDLNTYKKKYGITPLKPRFNGRIGPLSVVIRGRWYGAMPGNIDSRAICLPEHQAKAGFPRLHAKSGEFRRTKVAPLRIAAHNPRFHHTLDLGHADSASNSFIKLLSYDHSHPFKDDGHARQDRSTHRDSGRINPPAA